jgi:hypothetical protein
VTVEPQEAGTASETGAASVGFAERIAVNLGTELNGGVKLSVGWKKLMCDCRAAGIEYWSVRILVAPVATCVNTENSAERRLLAWVTETVISSMSPAGVTGLAATLFSASHSVTALSVSSVGFTNSATYQ